MEKIDVFKRVVEILNETGFGDGEAYVIEDYSGRAMYGKTVPAIVTDRSGVTVGRCIAQVLIDEGVDYIDDHLDMFPGRTDNMGRYSMVFY